MKGSIIDWNEAHMLVHIATSESQAPKLDNQAKDYDIADRSVGD
jgi:hypothetical protein